MVKKIALFIVLILIVQSFSAFRVDASVNFRDLVAKSAILAEKDNGIILYDNNANIRHPADALTKIMTLLLAAYAVENDEISDYEMITITETAWYGIDENSSTQNIQPGEVMTFIDLMYSAYVGNANEACNMLALRIAGSLEGFVVMMNERAAIIGATNTRFTNTHGQYHEMQYTTAYDMYLIFSEAMKSALFTEVSSTFRHITEGTDVTESRTLTSSNNLINPGSRYYYRSCISGRDSATYEGGHSLVAYTEEEGLSLISVVLGSSDVILDDESTNLQNFSETMRLLQWGYTQFAWRDVLKTTDLLERVPIIHGSGAEFVNARPEEALTLLLNNAIPTDSFIKTTTLFYDEDDPLVAPIEAGMVVGEVVVTRNGIEYARMALVANTDINLSGLEYMRGQISDLLATNLARNVIIVLSILLLLYVALVVRYNIVRANRLRRIRNAKNDIIRERHQNFRD